MRIGLLTTSFPRFSGDGAGSFVLGFARALAARGHTVQVLAPEPSEPVGSGRTPPRWPGVELCWVPYARPRGIESLFYGAGVPDNVAERPWRLLLAAPFVASLGWHAARASAGWDAIVSHWALPSALVAGIVARGRPHLAVLHSADVHWLTRLPMSRLVASRVVRTASSLVFSASAVAERFFSLLDGPDLRLARAQSVVSPMGWSRVARPSIARRDAGRKALGVSGFLPLFLGRMVPLKGAADLGAALRGVGDTTLLVAGAGPEETAVREQLRRHLVPARFFGWVHGRRKADLLGAADLLVLPSRALPSGRTEGAPVAAIEAMAAGLPVVASRVGGVPDLVADGESGLLVPPSAPEALGRAIVRLKEDRALRLRLGRAARRRARRYRWEHVMERLAPRIGA